MNDPVFKVTEGGVTAPTYAEVQQALEERMREIFGEDINLNADTPDGQLVSIFALAIADVNAQAVKLHADFSPSTATGVSLDSVVKVNGLTRSPAVGSTVDLTIVGQGGTVIHNGVAQDENRHRWLLPKEVLIPPNGEITVTAKAENNKPYEALTGSVHLIATPVRGWQSVTNKKPAIVGIPVETDRELQLRQRRSTARPSCSLWEGIVGEVLDLAGVRRVSGIRNNDDKPESHGIPGHTIALIVDGGDVTEIANSIYLKSGTGCGTYGDIETVIIDQYGFPNVVRFSRPKSIEVHCHVKIKPSDTYLSQAEYEIKDRVSDYINTLRIGESVNLSRVMATIIKHEGSIDDRFELDELKLGKDSRSLNPRSIEIAWNEAVLCKPEWVTVEVSEK